MLCIPEPVKEKQRKEGSSLPFCSWPQHVQWSLGRWSCGLSLGRCHSEQSRSCGSDIQALSTSYHIIFSVSATLGDCPASVTRLHHEAPSHLI